MIIDLINVITECKRSLITKNQSLMNSLVEVLFKLILNAKDKKEGN